LGEQVTNISTTTTKLVADVLTKVELWMVIVLVSGVLESNIQPGQGLTGLMAMLLIVVGTQAKVSLG